MTHNPSLCGAAFACNVSVVQDCPLSIYFAKDDSEDSQKPRSLAGIHFVQLNYMSEGSFAPSLARRPLPRLQHDCVQHAKRMSTKVPSKPGIPFAILLTIVTSHCRAE